MHKKLNPRIREVERAGLIGAVIIWLMRLGGRVSVNRLPRACGFMD